MIKVNIRVGKDTLNRDLQRALRAAKNPGPALAAGGQIVVEHAKRAFREPALRPSTWPALAAKTLEAKRRARKSNAMLIREGRLIRTPRVVNRQARRVIVGSDLFYARFHQMGEGVPLRPFWPFHRNGQMTAGTRAVVSATIRRKLGVVNS